MVIHNYFEFDNGFDSFESDPKSAVFQVYPPVFGDNRGFFAEVFRDTKVFLESVPEWFQTMNWVRQVNVSSSSPGVVRGLHAQIGPYCQGKLVKALTCPIYDVITDARPNSETFGVSSVYLLDPLKQNQLWVPRGFLHGFVVPINASCNALFEYWCDNVYDKASEIGVNPATVMPELAKSLKHIVSDEKLTEMIPFFKTVADNTTMSEKDMAAKDYNEFMNEVKAEFEKTGKTWYR